MTKTSSLLISWFALLLFLISCNDDVALVDSPKASASAENSETGLTNGDSFNPLSPNTWVPSTDFPGGNRARAAVFQIGAIAYVGTGESTTGLHSDFWAFNTLTQTWTRIADFPGTPRKGAVGFSLDSNGYVGLGTDSTTRKDFYKYNPATNSWSQIADYPATNGRTGSVSFTIISKGYVGSGSYSVGDTTFVTKDFWAYQPGLNTWTPIAPLPTPRTDAYAFSVVRVTPSQEIVEPVGIVCGGRRKDAYRYSAITNVWTRIADGPYYSGMAAFSIGSRGFVQGAGEFTMYNTTTGLWTSKAAFPIVLFYGKGFSYYDGINTFSGITTGSKNNNTPIAATYMYQQ